MGGSRWRQGAGGVLAVALLVSGLLVRVSHAGGGGITGPTVIELTTPGCRHIDDCHIYRLRDDQGARTGTLRRSRDPLYDLDGNPAGTSFGQCFGAKRTGTICMLVLNLTPGPHTELGAITTAGIRHESFPNTLAVTGGTGAYQNVRGELIATTDARGFVFTLNLIP